MTKQDKQAKLSSFIHSSLIQYTQLVAVSSTQLQYTHLINA